MSDKSPTKIAVNDLFWFTDSNASISFKLKAAENMIVDAPVVYTNCDPNVLYIMAEGYMLRSQQKEVAAILDALLSINPNDKNPITHCTRMFLLREEPDKLIQYWNTQYPKENKRPITLYLVIEAYTKLGADIQKVIQLYEENKSMLRQFSKAKLFANLGKLLGETYLKINKFSECKALLNEEREDAFKNKRDPLIINETIAKCGFFLNDENLINSVENDSSTIKIIKAKLYFKQKRYDDSKELLNELLINAKEANEKENTIKLLCLLGDINFQSKDYSKALSFYKKSFKKIEPVKSHTFSEKYKSQILFNIGKCFYNLGKYSDAVEEFNKCTITSFKLFNKYKLLASAKCSSTEFILAYEDLSKVKNSFLSKFPEAKLVYLMDKYFVQYDVTMLMPLKEAMSMPSIPQFVKYILDSICGNVIIWDKPKPYNEQYRDPTPVEVYNQATLYSFMCDSSMESAKYCRLSLSRHLKLLRLMKMGGELELNCHTHCVLLMYSLYEARKCGIGNNDLIEDCKAALNSIYKCDSAISDIIRDFDRY